MFVLRPEWRRATESHFSRIRPESGYSRIKFLVRNNVQILQHGKGNPRLYHASSPWKDQLMASKPSIRPSYAEALTLWRFKPLKHCGNTCTRTPEFRTKWSGAMHTGWSDGRELFISCIHRRVSSGSSILHTGHVLWDFSQGSKQSLWKLCSRKWIQDWIPQWCKWNNGDKILRSETYMTTR